MSFELEDENKEDMRDIFMIDFSNEERRFVFVMDSYISEVENFKSGELWADEVECVLSED